MSPRTWGRLRAYPHVAEIHVSANDGRRDRHDPLSPDTFGLPWARERAAEGVPVIVESHWHRQDDADRRRQLAWLREGR